MKLYSQELCRMINSRIFSPQEWYLRPVLCHNRGWNWSLNTDLCMDLSICTCRLALIGKCGQVFVPDSFRTPSFHRLPSIAERETGNQKEKTKIKLILSIHWDSLKSINISFKRKHKLKPINTNINLYRGILAIWFCSKIRTISSLNISLNILKQPCLSDRFRVLSSNRIVFWSFYWSKC